MIYEKEPLIIFKYSWRDFSNQVFGLVGFFEEVYPSITLTTL